MTRMNDKDEHLGSESSDDSGDDQYDTDPTEPDCDKDQLKDAGDVSSLWTTSIRQNNTWSSLSSLTSSCTPRRIIAKAPCFCLTKLRRDGISVS